MGMKKLLSELTRLKNSPVSHFVAKRLKEFARMKNASNEKLFQELCFCILTANFSAERAMFIQKKLANGFLALPQEQLTIKLRELGHRFPDARANYIVRARKYSKMLKPRIFSFPSGRLAREWLVKNVAGIGYKEASHFLRNIGFEDVAIIDFHIIDLLFAHGLVADRIRSLGKKRYLEIEKLLTGIAKRAGMNLAELDLYLWYLETGKVLK